MLGRGKPHDSGSFLGARKNSPSFPAPRVLTAEILGGAKLMVATFIARKIRQGSGRQGGLWWLCFLVFFNLFK